MEILGRKAAMQVGESRMTEFDNSRGQHWPLALAKVMGYPVQAPSRHTIAFCASHELDQEVGPRLIQLATETGKDILSVGFRSIDAKEPNKLSLAVHRSAGVHWLTGCRLYAASEKAKVALIHDDKRWFFDDRNQLVSTSLPPRHRLTRGEQVAWWRLRLNAAWIQGVQQHDEASIASSRDVAAILPSERLSIAC